MPDLSAKVAIVSGGATLIGEKTAQAFVDAGAGVVIADINEADGKRVAKALGNKAGFIKTDITDDAQIENCIAYAETRFGGVDFLVNLACTYLDKGLDSLREDWLAALNVNLVSGAIFTQKIASHMQQRGGGAIVNFGSIAAKRAQPGRLLYSASKAAILGMTRNQALLLAADGIRVNSVSPGWTWSNVIRDFSGNDRVKADKVAEPLHINGRLVDAEEVAAAVVFLCSGAAAGINGSDIAVDGGYTAIGPEQKIDRVSRLAD